jgi:hypothetical protein
MLLATCIRFDQLVDIVIYASLALKFLVIFQSMPMIVIFSTCAKPPLLQASQLHVVRLLRLINLSQSDPPMHAGFRLSDLPRESD